MTKKFHLCSNLSPLGKGVAPYLNKLESPSPKDALCQVWFKQAQRFLRRRFLNFVNVFSLFRNYLPLEKGTALYLNQIKQKRFREEVVKFGGRTKHSVRLDGKPRKCLSLPKKAMTSQQWETVTAALLRIGLSFTSKSHS